MHKKDPYYLMALVNVAMMQRCEDFLSTWRQEGPKCIGLPKESRNAETLEDAHGHLRTLISNSEKGGHLCNVIRDLQVLDHRKLMSLPNCYYLQALAEVREDNLIQ